MLLLAPLWDVKVTINQTELQGYLEKMHMLLFPQRRSSVCKCSKLQSYIAPNMPSGFQITKNGNDKSHYFLSV